MGIIIAIGGGELSKRETLPLDRRIVAACGKAHPQALFVPTASYDAPGYIDTFTQVYEELGCAVDTLCLYDASLTPEEAHKRILAADLIYVGGGNTATMMAKWKETHVDDMLREAFSLGKILCGLSAGSICWFAAGHSDSQFFDNVEHPVHQWVEGLGLLPLLHCPHYNEPGRETFNEMMRGQALDGFALDNGVALALLPGGLEIWKADESAKAWLFIHEGTEIFKREWNDLTDAHRYAASV